MARSLLSFRLCLLFALPTAVLLCSCGPATTREILCGSIYVIRGEVTEVEDVMSTERPDLIVAKLLHVKIQEIYMMYKKMLAWTNGETVKLRTRGDSGRCGWVLDSGVYIIGGTLYEGDPWLTVCDYTVKWSTASQDDKDLISEVASDIKCAGIPVTLPQTTKQKTTETVTQTVAQTTMRNATQTVALAATQTSSAITSPQTTTQTTTETVTQTVAQTTMWNATQTVALAAIQTSSATVHRGSHTLAVGCMASVYLIRSILAK